MEKKRILEELRALQAMAQKSRDHLEELESAVDVVGEQIDDTRAIFTGTPTKETLVGRKASPLIENKKSGTMVGGHLPKPPASQDPNP